jgi:hypothetical protein
MEIFLGLRHAHPFSWHGDELCVRKSVFLSWGAALVSYQVALAKDSPQNIVESTRFDTGTPEETFANIKVRLHLGPRP